LVVSRQVGGKSNQPLIFAAMKLGNYRFMRLSFRGDTPAGALAGDRIRCAAAIGGRGLKQPTITQR